jgi:hypothetical protein
MSRGDYLNLNLESPTTMSLNLGIAPFLEIQLLSGVVSISIPPGGTLIVA